MLVAKQITFNLWLIRHFKTPPIPTDGKLFASKIGSLDQVWPFSAANDPIIWRPSNLTNLGRAPFYGLQPTWGGVRFLGGSPHLATAVVIREVQIGDFSHSRHSHLPHLGARLVVWVLRNFFEIRSLSETMKKDLSTAFYCPLLWGWQLE